MQLLALLISFALFHVISKPQFLQSYAWMNNLKQLWLSKEYFKQPWLNILIIFLPVIVITGLVSYWLHQYHSHLLWYLLFNCIVLFYCLGPEQLEQHLALQTEQLDIVEPPAKHPQLIINRLTDEAIQRWFAVFFWFVVAGAAGALAYRLLRQTLVDEKSTPTELHVIITKTVWVLEYPVILLMAVSLLIASDFDRIWRHCKSFFKRPHWYRYHSPFLYDAMDFAVKNCEIDAEKPYSQQTLEVTTLSVLKRMLMVWLVLVALIVLLTIG